MVDREFDGLLTPEERLAHARIQAIIELGNLAGVLGGDRETAEVLADRLRTSQEADVVEFHKYAAGVLRILGIGEGVVNEEDITDSEPPLKGVVLPEPIDDKLRPISDLLEQNSSFPGSSHDDMAETFESEGGPWLQRVTREYLDGIEMTDQAVCHIREAVFELMDVAGIDHDYFKADLCRGMIARLRVQKIHVFDVSDEYLEGLIRIALEYPKEVPMSAQIVNGICFWASLKGVPLKNILPYRALSWPNGAYRGPSEGNVNTSRYFIENYVNRSIYDAYQQESQRTRDEEQKRVDTQIAAIAQRFDTAPTVDTETVINDLLLLEEASGAQHAEVAAKILGLVGSEEDALKSLLSDEYEGAVDNSMRLVIQLINNALNRLSPNRDVVSYLGNRDIEGMDGRAIFRHLFGRFKDTQNRPVLQSPTLLSEQLEGLSEEERRRAMRNLFTFLTFVWVALAKG